MAVSLDVALCSLTFGNACNIQLFAGLEDFYCKFLVELIFRSVFNSDFLEILLRSCLSLFEVTLERLGNSVSFLISIADLNRFVTVCLSSLNLSYDDRTRFDYCYRNCNARFGKKSASFRLFS